MEHQKTNMAVTFFLRMNLTMDSLPQRTAKWRGVAPTFETLSCERKNYMYFSKFIITYCIEGVNICLATNKELKDLGDK